MKLKTTAKEVKRVSKVVLKIRYGYLQTLLKYETPVAYTSGSDGWFSDIYMYAGGTICVGRKPFGQEADSELIDEFENKARKVVDEFGYSRERMNNLIESFIEKATK